jgi:hypothetical protein
LWSSKKGGAPGKVARRCITKTVTGMATPTATTWRIHRSTPRGSLRGHTSKRKKDRRGRQAERDGTEKERGCRALPEDQDQERDADRNGECDGYAPRCFHNNADALRSVISPHLARLTPFTVNHTANDSSPLMAGTRADGDSIEAARISAALTRVSTREPLSRHALRADNGNATKCGFRRTSGGCICRIRCPQGL